MKMLAMVLLLTCLTAQAEPLPYFEMRQVVPAATDPDETNWVGVSVENYLLTNANPQAQATNLFTELQSGIFDGLKTTAQIHWHDHYNPTPCVMEFVAEHSSSTNKTDKWIQMVEDLVQDPNFSTRYLAETWTVAVTSKQDAKDKEDTIKALRPGKQWKPVKEHVKE